MTDWDDLDRELDAWGVAGKIATLWWRDDDARAPGPALDRLLAIATAAGVGPALAVIPSGATAALAARLAAALPALPGLAVLPHGYAHQNHAPDGAGKAELGPHRPFPVTLGELATGAESLAALCRRAGAPAIFRPVMVPPWNRIDPALVPMLAETGFTGLSVFGPRARPRAVPGLACVNTHVDIIDWRGDRGFAGPAACLAALAGHLAARRSGAVDGSEPTGLLTHHLRHDDAPAAPAFMEDLLARTAGHPAAAWLDGLAVFPDRADGGSAAPAP